MKRILLKLESNVSNFNKESNNLEGIISIRFELKYKFFKLLMELNKEMSPFKEVNLLKERIKVSS